jgi:hypothetical protein
MLHDGDATSPFRAISFLDDLCCACKCPITPLLEDPSPIQIFAYRIATNKEFHPFSSLYNVGHLVTQSKSGKIRAVDSADKTPNLGVSICTMANVEIAKTCSADDLRRCVLHKNRARRTAHAFQRLMGKNEMNTPLSERHSKHESQT